MLSSLAETDQPQRTGKEQRHAGIDQNWQNDFVVESEVDEDSVGHYGQNHTGEHADQPCWEKRTQNIKRRRLPAAGKPTRRWQSR
jgi:hypothetical protein